MAACASCAPQNENSWVNQKMLSVKMLTNLPEMRLFFVPAHETEG